MKYWLHHISYAVRSTESCVKLFSLMHPRIIAYRKLEESQNAFITYLSNESKPYIELVEPKDTAHSLWKILGEQELQIYHLCYESDYFEPLFNFFLEKGFYVLTKPFKVSVEENKTASHLYHPNAGIIEVMGQ